MIIFRMTKVKKFVKTLGNSLVPDAYYYRKIAHLPFHFSFSYLLTLILLLNLIFTILLAIKFFPTKSSKMISNLVSALEAFPKELKVQIDQGNLITTYNRPYFMWMNDGAKKKLLLVIDESATAVKIDEYKSNVLITSNEIVIKNNKNVVSLPLSRLPFQNISKQEVVQWANRLKSINQLWPFIFLPVLMIVFIFLSIGSTLSTLFYLIIASFVNLIVYRLILVKKFAFKKIWQLSFHAVTLPLILDYGLMIFKTQPLPILFLILSSVFVFCAIYEAYLDNELLPTHKVSSPHHKHHK